MFADADIDLKKRSKQDPILLNLIELSSDGYFRENFELLAGIF
jgi:hypothetical protein